MAIMQSYDLNGKKLSFANWISNLSPTETPFVTMTGKEAVAHTKFSWQTDYLAPVAAHNIVEGSDAENANMHATEVLTNYTQILRRVVKVSDTANLIAAYGRGRELAYQLEKAGNAIKRDLEVILLSGQTAVAGDSATARKTAGFEALVAGEGVAHPDTGAVVSRTTAASGIVEYDEIRAMMYHAFIANNKADTIMFHPKWASRFANLLGAKPQFTRLLDDDLKTFSLYVNTITDTYGREWKLVPNRFMPKNKLYFFNPSDFTQMVLRAPQRIKLAKEGSFEQWMIEMEVGLRLDNPFAAGVLTVKA